jgi:hypothetical protein
VIQRFPHTSISLCTSRQVYIVLASYRIEGSDTFIANSTARICYRGRGGVCCPVSQTSTLSRHRPRMSLALSPAGLAR